jgi:hypothetical protein
MIKIKSTVIPENRPSESEWFSEFNVGILTKKMNDRASDIMKMWIKPGHNYVDYSGVIRQLKDR